jgi:hypothetical protein
LILRYGVGGWNALHQDLYGVVFFPFQVLSWFCLSRAWTLRAALEELAHRVSVRVLRSGVTASCPAAAYCAATGKSAHAAAARKAKPSY